VSTQIPHGAGIAYAFKYRKQDAAVLTFVGDGGTSEGDFYEALNFAGVFKLPLITIIENNQWAISQPRSRQTAAKTLAQKGIAAGISCVQVDGNDMLAVYKAVRDAIANAKNGPTLIEAVTCRLSMHTTSDDPTKYRTDADVAAWQKKDPVARVKAYLAGKKQWDDAMEQKTAEEQQKQIDDAVAKAEAFKPDPRSMFENVYSFMPEVLKQEEDAAESANFWR
jgi:TPP-dependent pyruvate/acetoin dehydrogenase alpha subunit